MTASASFRNAALARRYRAVAAYTGLVWAMAGLLLLTPLVGLAFYPEEARLALHFVAPGLLLLALGLGLRMAAGSQGHPALGVQEGAIIVTLGWLAAFVFSAWPFMGILNLDFTRAVFEAVSGLTTTGLSVVDVSTAPRTILLWRGIMQLAGGAGLAIIMLAAIAGPAGTGIAGAEGRSDRLAPHVRKSAVVVLGIYGLYAAFGIPALALAGMDWFDAVNHAFAAISTGGFSTRPESIGYWNSPVVEAVTILLMILGGMNFLTASLLLRGRWRAVLRNSELRFFLVMAIAGAACLAIALAGLHPDWAGRVRVAVFEAVSAATTTGFSTVDYAPWTALGIHVAVVLMVIGGGTGSTAGGLKQYRVRVLLGAVVWDIRRRLLPARAVLTPSVFMGERREFLDDGAVARAAAFTVLYMACLALGAGIVASCGHTLRDSLFEFTSALGTVGLSVGVTSASSPDLLLWTETVGMVLGRLEFFVVVICAARLAGDLPRLLRHRRGQ